MCKRSTVGNCMKGYDGGDYGKGTRPSKTMNKTRIIRHRRLNIKHKVNVIQKQQRHDKVSFYLTRPDSFERTISPFVVNHTEKSFRFCHSKQSKVRRSTPPHSKLSICFKFFNRLSQMNVCYAHFSSIYFFQDI